jgi:enamine deaminase RidA (YjgF/YER057c/UK114 family)
MNDIESRLNALGLVIPTPASSVANYVGWTTTGNLIFTAGQLALVNGKLNYPGIVGGDMDVETAKLSARLCAINVIAQFKTACNGDLNRITRIIKVTGFYRPAQSREWRIGSLCRSVRRRRHSCPISGGRGSTSSQRQR